MRRFFALVTGGVLLGLLTACESNRVEGCLEAGATNFNFTADRPCSECCTYPSLVLELAHKVVIEDTAYNFVLESGYLNNLGDTFAVKDIRFYLSGFRLLRSDGSWANVSDTLNLTLNSGAVANVTDDFVLVKRSQTSYTIGDLPVTGDFVGLSFLVGLDDVANGTSPANISDEESPLAEQTDAMYDTENGSYIFNKIRIIPDTSRADVYTTYLVTDTGNARRVTLYGDFTIERGYTTKLGVSVDYLALFRGIDFDGDSNAAVVGKIVANTAAAFY